MRGPKKEKADFVYKRRRATITTVLFRFMALFLLISMISGIVYIDRDSYNDSQDGEISELDAIYFTVVSITTTGYGDIVPVKQDARIIDTVFITIGRAAMWFVIVGTAYQFVFERYREAYLMKAIQKRLSDHVIIVGFSTAGRSTARELQAKGMKKGQIVVISSDPTDAQDAAETGYVSILGDASKEKNLKDAMILKARAVVIATRRDDTNVLISLTAKDLNPDVKVISQVTDLENIKLLRKSGVETIIAPGVTAGSLMATATTQPYVVNLLEDVMTSETGMYLSQRGIMGSEIGKDPRSLKSIVVLGVVRNKKVLSLERMDDLKLKEGDGLLFMDDKHK